MIPLEEVPAAALESFRRRYPDVPNPSVERTDDGERYGFEIPSGSVIYFDRDGEPRGEII